MARKAAATIILPVSVVGRVDVVRLSREVEAIDEQLRQNTLRGKKETATLPQLSQALEDLIKANQLDMLHSEDRVRLQQFLQDLKKTGSNIHMSFAAVPSPAFTAKLLEWLRQEVHPALLLDIGLQPTIVAGCVIRTTNKSFDCSVRQRFASNRSKLVELIGGKAA